MIYGAAKPPFFANIFNHYNNLQSGIGPKIPSATHALIQKVLEASLVLEVSARASPQDIVDIYLHELFHIRTSEPDLLHSCRNKLLDICSIEGE